jgi:hypothetical protein
MKYLIIKLLLLFYFANINLSRGQDCLDDILHNKLYSDTDDIINGKKWINEKKYLGSPLLMEKYWPAAELLYSGNHYKGILMNYDLYKNELIIFLPEKDKEKYVVIGNDNLTSFSYTDTITGMKHFFEYIELQGITGKALYENASVGKVSLYLRPWKKIESKNFTSGYSEYLNYYEYYIDAGGGYIAVRSKSQLIRLLSKHTSELNRYIRNNNIKNQFRASRRCDRCFKVL